MTKQNPHQESRQPVPAKKATSLAPTKQCFLVRGDYTEPSEDENDSHPPTHAHADLEAAQYNRRPLIIPKV